MPNQDKNLEKITVDSAGSFEIPVARPSAGKKIEQSPSPEQISEQAPEKSVAPASAPKSKNDFSSATAEPILPEEDLLGAFYVQKVEDILQDGLGEVYSKMSPERKLAFKQAGEETASKISVLLDSTKVKLGKVFELIVGWLKLIPGINKFFLEQEAKLKADRIVALKKKK